MTNDLGLKKFGQPGRLFSGELAEMRLRIDRRDLEARERYPRPRGRTLLKDQGGLEVQACASGANRHIASFIADRANSAK